MNTMKTILLLFLTLILILPISVESAITVERAISGGCTVPPKKPVSPAQKERLLIGYYPAWASYTGFTPDRIDAKKLTHINYAFAKVGKDLKIAMGYPDRDPANFKRLAALKKKNPELKTLISVGGWSWSDRFSDAALTDDSRTAFAESCAAFIRKHGFDGIDIDWEYPVSGGLDSNAGRPSDKHNFTLLLKKLRETLDAQGKSDGKHYLLTIAAGAGATYPDKTELSEIHKYLDYAAIMTYDLHGTWDRYTDLHAPLYENSDPSPQYKSSVDSAVKAWEKSDFPMDKLVLGIPFYGYLYSSVNGSNQGLYQTFSGANAIGYDRIKKDYLVQRGFQRHLHPQSKVPWLFNGTVFITYEDTESIRAKTDYIKAGGLGGAMVWELSRDQDAELLKALNDGLK